MGKARITVVVRNRDINKALKIFKKNVLESGHLLELRERQEYLKPSVVKRKQKQNAIREEQKKNILQKIADGDKSLRFYTKKRKKRKDNVKPKEKTFSEK